MAYDTSKFLLITNPFYVIKKGDIYYNGISGEHLGVVSDSSIWINQTVGELSKAFSGYCVLTPIRQLLTSEFRFEEKENPKITENTILIKTDSRLSKLGAEYTLIEDENYVLKKGDRFHRGEEKRFGSAWETASSYADDKYTIKRLKKEYPNFVVAVKGKPKLRFPNSKPYPFGY